jgi:hypothetical protein
MQAEQVSIAQSAIEATPHQAPARFQRRRCIPLGYKNRAEIDAGSAVPRRAEQVSIAQSAMEATPQRAHTASAKRHRASR